MWRIGRKDTPLDPADGPDTDLLDIGPYSNGLHYFARNCDTPMTVGLQGEWGSGKTSLMKLVRGRFESEADKESVITFWFETWQYGAVGGSDALGMLLLRDLTDQLLESLQGDPSVYKFREQFGAAVRAALPSAMGMAASMATRSEEAGKMITAATGAAMGAGGAARNNMRACFSELVQKALASRTGDDKRLVVFIDDLDRVPPVLAVRLLEVLKNFMDVKDCVFIVACDYEVVREGVGKLMGISEDQMEGSKREKVDAFFHKLFQVQFQMPVGAYKIDKLLREYVTTWLRLHNGVDKIKAKREQLAKEKEIKDFLATGASSGSTQRVRADGWFENLLAVVDAAVGTNPRAVKRFLNLVELTCCVDGGFSSEGPANTVSLAHWLIGKPEQDLQTLRWCTSLFPIVAVQQRWPEVAAAWLAGAEFRGRPDSSLGDKAYTAFERRLRTIVDRWPGDEHDRDVIETELEDETFRQQLSDAFGCDIRHENAPASVRSLMDFAQHWFDLLNNQASVDDVLDDHELSVLIAWSRRVADMGTSNIQLTGLARLRQDCMVADPRAGDGFVALGSHMLRFTRDSPTDLLGGEQGSSSVWIWLRCHGSNRTLMSIYLKATTLMIKINATHHMEAKWRLPGLGDAGHGLIRAMVDGAGVDPAHIRETGASIMFDFGKGHTAARNALLREVLSTFVSRAEDLVGRSHDAAELAATPGTHTGAEESSTSEAPA